MYIVMYKDEYNDLPDEVTCIFQSKRLAIEMYFPMGIDKLGRSIDEIENGGDCYQGFYLIEAPDSANILSFLVNKCIDEYCESEEALYEM